MTTPTPPSGYSTLITAFGFRAAATSADPITMFLTCNRCGGVIANTTAATNAHTTFHNNLGLLNVNLGLKL